MEQLIGFILPPFIDLVNRRVIDTRIRFVIAFVVCLVVGAIIRFNELKAGDVMAVLQSLGIVFAESQIVYKLYWESSSARTGLFGK